LRRCWIIGALCAVLVVAGGCSAIRLGYSQAPELLYWWLDGYADFDDAQTRRVRDALGRWFAWHRRTQLPDYAALLARAQADALADTTPDKACVWWNELRLRIDKAFAAAVPFAAELVPTLSAEQIQHIERRFAKSNDEFRDEYLKEDAAQRRKDAVRRGVERAETLYGKLDDAQRERVAAAVAASPFDPELWLVERQRRQQDALQVLRAVAAMNPERDRERIEAALQGWADRIATSPRPAYRRYADQLTRYNCSASAELHNSTSPAQRLAAVAKFKGWETDVRALAAAANGAN
jgi:hypothetical protein